MMKNTKKGKVWSAICYTSAALITYFGFVGIEAKATEIKKLETVLEEKFEIISTPITKNPVEHIKNVETELKSSVAQDPIILNYIKREKSSGNFSHKDNVYFYVVDENLKVSIYNRYGVIQNEKDFTYELKAVSKEEKEKQASNESFFSVESNKKNEIDASKEVHTIVEKKAKPREGLSAFMRNFVIAFKFPSDVNLDEIKFRLRFIVETDGSFSNIHAVNGFFEPKEFDEILHKEAIRTLQKMPNWDPAEHEGKIVRSTFTLPITIRINPLTEQNNKTETPQ